MSKVFLFVVVITVLVVGSLWFFSQNSELVAPSPDSASLEVHPDTQVANTATNTQSTATSTADTVTNKNFMYATLHTNKGDITIEFSSKDAPNTVANFIKLAGSKFYDGIKFHRVIKGFMNQAGDPLTKDDSQKAMWGTGGPGYSFNDEITPNEKNNIGAVAMANSGPNTNGSQFFINVANNNFLDGKYTVFGKVTEGMDVVTAINNTPTDSSDRPLTPVVIESISLK